MCIFINKTFLQVNEDDLSADIDELFKQGKIIKEFNLNLDLTDSNMWCGTITFLGFYL